MNRYHEVTIRAQDMPDCPTLSSNSGKGSDSLEFEIIRDIFLWCSVRGIFPGSSRWRLIVREVQIRFYAELNDFLDSEKRTRAFRHNFLGNVSVKDMIEGLGAPHTEVDLILANGESVGFDYRVQDNDRISVYPVFETIDIAPLLKVRSEPLRTVSFVLDIHLGKLCRYLRILGFDVLWENYLCDEELSRISRSGRILLTRDRGLLKRKIVTHGYCVRQSNPRAQVLEVIRRFDLAERIRPFTRCIRCNACVNSVAKQQIEHRLSERTRRYYEKFSICPGCDRIYWEGSHHVALKRMVASIEEEIKKPLTSPSQD